MGVGKLGSMYGELTSISNMGSDRDSNLRPNDHQARTLTTAPSCYPKECAQSDSESDMHNKRVKSVRSFNFIALTSWFILLNS